MIKWFRRKSKQGPEQQDQVQEQAEKKEEEAGQPVEDAQVPTGQPEVTIEPEKPEEPTEQEKPSEPEMQTPAEIPLEEGPATEREITAEVAAEEPQEEELEKAEESGVEEVPKKGFFKRLRERFHEPEEHEEPIEHEGPQGPGPTVEPEIPVEPELPAEPELAVEQEKLAEPVELRERESRAEPEAQVPVEIPVEEGPVPEQEAPAEDVAETLPEEQVEETGEVETGEEDVPRKGFFKRLRERLHKTREKFVDRIDRLVLGKKVIDEDLLDELEEILITSDLGVKTTEMLLRKVADKVKRKELSDPSKLREQIREEIRAVLSVDAPPLDYRADRPFVIMIIGVNGVGKTTTIGKLANQLKRQHLKLMLVAGDTFRAAAVEQLSIWGERVGVPVIKQKSGSDPSAVVFDALDAAIARDVEVLLVDTAGRMHTKVNLMEELKKIHRVINKKMPAAPHEVFLVLDASTGQNALSQARLFKEGIGLTGLILTKLDGTAKGGIVAAICDELKVPVRYIGIGESLDDLRPFDPDEFTRALF